MPSGEYTENEGEFLFSASGDFDEKRDEDFAGVDYSGCINIDSCWNEAELPEDELFDIVCRYISLTMVNAGTSASQRLNTNFDFDR